MHPMYKRILLKLSGEALAGEKPQEEFSSSKTAANRLRILLINDRAGVNSEDVLPQLRVEIIEVLKKYISIDSIDDLQIKYENSDDTHMIEMSVSLDADSYHRLNPNSLAKPDPKA